MSDEYLSKEEIRKWRSSVEKITLEEYAARLGKKLQEEKKTNDLADMLYTHFNPHQSMENYDSITKLEKIDLTPKVASSKNKHASKEEVNDFVLDNYNKSSDEKNIISKTVSDGAKNNNETEKNTENSKKSNKSETIKVKDDKKSKQNSQKTQNNNQDNVKETVTNKNIKVEKESSSKQTEKLTQKDKKVVAAKNKKAEKTSDFDFSSLNITFNKSLTDREEKVLAYFIEKRGEIVYAKDLAELLELKRDYIYKYIKNLRSKMSTDIIVNADNGGFKLE